MNNKTRLWRVQLTSVTGANAPSFWVETSTPGNKDREVAEQEAIQLAKEYTALSRFPKVWRIKVTHLEGLFQVNGRWVPQGVYKLKDGIWVKNREKS